MAKFFNGLYGLPESPVWFLGNTQAQVIGTLLVIVFCYLGSVMPIWSFAQPINYVSYGSVFLTIMALTIMQLVIRFMRVASAELVGEKFPAMKNVHVGTIGALILTLIFVWVIPWLTIWSAFGAANQLMGGLALMLISLWAMSEGRKHTWALYPAAFMIVTTIAALFYLAYDNFFRKLPAATTPRLNVRTLERRNVPTFDAL